MDIVGPIKAHPYVVVGGVAAVLIFLQLRKKSGGASSGGSNVYAFTQDPNVIAANAAITQADLAAGVANNQTQAALKLGLAQTGAAQDVALAQTHAAQDVTNNQTAATIAINASNDAATTQQTQIVTQGHVAQARIGAVNNVINQEFAALPSLGNYYTRQQFDQIAGFNLAAAQTAGAA